jgi:PAS domain-containing protein
MLAVVLVALATALRAALDPILGPRYSLGIYLAATLAAGLLFNAVPAMVALVLGGLAGAYFFTEPRRVIGMGAGDLIGLAMYAAVGGLVCLLVDRLHMAVAARERAELAMARAYAAKRQTEEEYRVAFELAAVGKAQSDPLTGRFLRVNDRFCALTGYAREELLSKSFRDITHPDDVGRNW